MKLTLSPLSKTWLIDVDGTIVKHNGHLDGEDQLLDGVLNFFSQIHKDDVVILMTARKERYIPALKSFLAKHKIRYDHLLADLPHGERILINDMKNSGLKTAFAINKKRDEGLNIECEIQEDL